MQDLIKRTEIFRIFLVINMDVRQTFCEYVAARNNCLQSECGLEPSAAVAVTDSIKYVSTTEHFRCWQDASQDTACRHHSYLFAPLRKRFLVVCEGRIVNFTKLFKTLIVAENYFVLDFWQIALFGCMTPPFEKFCFSASINWWGFPQNKTVVTNIHNMVIVGSSLRLEL